jgi:hypothetical protein
MPAFKSKNNTKKVIKASQATKHKTGSGGAPSGAALTILNTAAALKAKRGKESIERKKLSALTGIQGKSTIANALTKMKNNGWMEVTPSTLTITFKGMELADPSAVSMADIPTTNVGFHESIKKQYKLKPKECALMDSIADGKTYIKKNVAAAIGCQMNSTFANMMTNLKKHDILEFDRTTMRLHDEMFPVEPRSE